MKRLAYLILAHADPIHLGRLVQALGAAADIYVHVDAKSPIEKFREVLSHTHAKIVEPRVRVAWAGISIVDATLLLMRAAIASPNEYHHLILLSGNDYPLKNSREIYSYFQANASQEFIRYIDMRQSKDHYMKQIEKRWYKEPWYKGEVGIVQKFDKLLRKVGNWLAFPNEWPSEITPYFGSQWWALTPSCVSYILEYIDANPHYRQCNRFTFAPDEHFFHTLVGNSKFAKNATGLEAYKKGGTFLLANLHVIHHSLQKWYTIDDWNDIACSEKLFVRKLGTKPSSELLDCIDRHLFE
jgi:hypothetical protein